MEVGEDWRYVLALPGLLVGAVQRNRTNRLERARAGVRERLLVYFKELVYTIVGIGKSEVCRAGPSAWKFREELMLQP